MGFWDFIKGKSTSGSLTSGAVRGALDMNDDNNRTAAIKIAAAFALVWFVKSKLK